MSYKLLIMGGKAIFIFWTCSAAFLSLYFLSLSVSFDSFFCHVFTFNFAERIKQNVGRQGFYGKLFYDFCVPAGKSHTCSHSKVSALIAFAKCLYSCPKKLLKEQTSYFSFLFVDSTVDGIAIPAHRIPRSPKVYQ